MRTPSWATSSSAERSSSTATMDSGSDPQGARGGRPAGRRARRGRRRSGAARRVHHRRGVRPLAAPALHQGGHGSSQAFLPVSRIVPLGEQLVALIRGEERQLRGPQVRVGEGRRKQPLEASPSAGPRSSASKRAVAYSIAPSRAPSRSAKLTARSSFAVVPATSTGRRRRPSISSLPRRRVLQREHRLEQGGVGEAALRWQAPRRAFRTARPGAARRRARSRAPGRGARGRWARPRGRRAAPGC